MYLRSFLCIYQHESCYCKSGVEDTFQFSTGEASGIALKVLQGMQCCRNCTEHEFITCTNQTEAHDLLFHEFGMYQINNHLKTNHDDEMIMTKVVLV